LLLRELDERLIRERFDESIAEQRYGHADGADRLGVGHTLLDFRTGKRRVGTDGTVIHQRAAGNHLAAVSDRNLRILEVSIAIQVTRANLGDLARSAGNGILVALAAGLRVVEWSEAVRDLFYGIEFREVRLMRCLVGDAIAAVVESRWRLDNRRR